MLLLPPASPSDPSANYTKRSKFTEYDELADAAGALLRHLVGTTCECEEDWVRLVAGCSLAGVAGRFGLGLRRAEV
jgi:hypothetical protein